MLELIKYIVGQFAEDKENVSYDVEETEDAINVTVTLSDSDMGKVIGKQGKIAKALRTLVRAATPKDSKKYNVEIKERSAENSL
ncbi:MAG TPA: KH domain-containing protein [Firmicutes bacterium]|nr:KH domain-containing protein [Bacillota bacterium]